MTRLRQASRDSDGGINPEVKLRAAVPLSRWDVPKNWLWVRVKDIATVVGGGTPSTRFTANFITPGKGIGWITPSDLTGYTNDTIGRGRRDLSDRGLATSGAQVVPSGSVLLSARAPIGYSVVASAPLATSQGFKTLILREGISPFFIRYYFTASKAFLNSLGSGTTFLELSAKKVLDIPVPLPPLREQQRIVERLQALEGHNRNARATLLAIPTQLEQARQSLLASGFTGSLTGDWRKDHPNHESGNILVEKLRLAHRSTGVQGRIVETSKEIHSLKPENFPDSWGLAELRDVCRPGMPITYGILMPGPDIKSGVPYIRVADYPGGILNLSSVRRTSREIADSFPRSKLSSGDILVSIRGSVGRITTIPVALAGANITQDSARISVSSLIDPEFIAWILRCPDTQRRLAKATRGVAIRGVNLADLRAIQIPIPPLQEQHEIVRRLNANINEIENASAIQSAAIVDLDRLNEVLLARAFRGELLPQDASDEPASVYIKRVSQDAPPSPMKKTNSATPAKQTLREVVLSFSKSRFTFEELQAHSVADYETLRDELFAILSEKPAILLQEFDKVEKRICLVRTIS